MNLDRYLPPSFLQDQEQCANPYSATAKLMERLESLATFVKRCCDRALKEEHQIESMLAEEMELGDDQDPPDLPASFMTTQITVAQGLAQLYDAWLHFYVESGDGMREIQNLKLQDGRPYRTTLGAHVFAELSRINWLQAQPQLLLERENMARIPISVWNPKDYDAAFALCHTSGDLWISIASQGSVKNTGEEKPPSDDEPTHVGAAREWRQRLATLWNTPIMQYTASQARVLMAFLTQQLNEVAMANLPEYRRVFRILWIRSTVLALHGWPADLWSISLDDGEMRTLLPRETEESLESAASNRAWYVYCSFYLGEVARRCYQFDLLSGQRIRLEDDETLSPEAVYRMKQWITNAVVGTLAEEAFEEIYQNVVNAADGAYAFPGDGGWFRYSNPQNVATLGAIITTLRPHLYERFFSEEQMDRNVVLAAVEKSHLARLFVLHALDSYMKITHARVEFLNAVVIDNGGIEDSEYALKSNMAPLLLQVFSRYWVYHDGLVYPCDDLWTTLTLWWSMLRENWDCKLHGIDLGEFAREALLPQRLDVPAGPAAVVNPVSFEL